MQHSRVAPSGSQTSSRSSGGAQSRSGSAGQTSSGSRVASPDGGAPAPPGPGGVARPRYGAPTQGQAVSRQPGNYPNYPSSPYDPYYPYYPYYSPYYYPYGYGFGFGYYGSYPWYGGYGSYGGGGGYSEGGGGNYTDVASGSIRLRASPANAKVYIDGTLMGIVDDFNGLSGHLDLPAGQHELELRADGYETYTGTINVLVGKTMTERVSLTKKK